MMAYNPSKNYNRLYEISAEEYAQLQEIQSKLQIGVKHSDDRKLKNSIAIKNKWTNSEYRNRITQQMKLNQRGCGNTMYGKNHTELTKTAISNANTGHIHSNEFREFQSQKFQHQWKSSKFRQKSIESHMGKLNTQAKSVYIDGNTYDTATDAFNAISPSCKYVAFCKRLRSTSKKYNNWYYL
jgi:hypothetical protein